MKGSIKRQLTVDLAQSADDLSMSFTEISDTGTLKLVSRSADRQYSINQEGLQHKDGMSYKISAADLREFNTIGTGACSTVKKAIDKRYCRLVAVKHISVLEKEKRHQLLNEVQTLCDADRYACPALVSFYGAFFTPESNQISIVLDYMDGGALSSVIEKAGRIPEDILARITERILQGLEFLHNKRHMVHRDIKPGNILMNLQGDAKITDFGISAGLESTMGVCQSYVGTMCYMSPERIQNDPYSPSADIWSLGLTLMEAATGQYPYDVNKGPFALSVQISEEAPPTLPNEEFSPEFCSFVSMCTDKIPTKRPSAEQLLQHPFLLKHRANPANCAAFMQRLIDPKKQIESYAQVIITHFYQVFDDDLDQRMQLSALYKPESLLSYMGEHYAGQAAISERFAAHQNVHPVAGRLVHELDKIDAQQTAWNRGIMILVVGKLVPESRTSSGTISFQETFVLEADQTPGSYWISHQMRREQVKQ
ncbi:hypothetical protein CYMTET_13147 [Cymbomonas tetramitiformis]|uniref:mitogen-activated protein kinase kinase n=1 Tax=Cymbomonas tetramitiformis TaxID=36881 RepID=A0AAE0GJ24_9CHLO|nr:hypothetical protein CYMTET_13147 [Cymbomonas tetramitiformis]|eukprot:gene21539-25905_t